MQVAQSRHDGLFFGEELSEYWWYPNSLSLKAEYFF
jgi:hypothetical protein